ncbi:recombination directionality factor [Microbacterium phage Stromboli]|uniref:recombination directionality factor n=1 Tax=Microbacterium Phage DirtyBubble TaxID=2590932 RepID=UPI00118CA59B|nr:recombination directionality factor [Microbacterium Phage DirtyBubble]YP_010752699.1 recombination directionality factor [Microbacterium phage Stromboli]QDP45052.1 recombination directionality factor [Microbacterium Phage DirtyBubble]QIN93694.1 recombination directionality factor [Microbacterium phage Stromboli]
MLKINTDAETTPEEQSDVVGRFRSGYQVDGTPASLSAFRVTTGDLKVAEAVAKAFGVDKDKLGSEAQKSGVQEWDAAGEDYLEVFTTTDSVNVILEGAGSYRSSLVRRTKDGDFMYATDGEVITAVGEDFEDEYEVGNPDPQLGQDLTTRKAKAKKGLGSSPDIRVKFTVADHPEWGTFEFRSGGWSLVHNDPEPKLRRLPEGPIKAVLKLTTVEGKRFTWTKPELIVRGSVGAAEKPEVAGGEDEPAF